MSNILVIIVFLFWCCCSCISFNAPSATGMRIENLSNHLHTHIQHTYTCTRHEKGALRNFVSFCRSGYVGGSVLFMGFAFKRSPFSFLNKQIFFYLVTIVVVVGVFIVVWSLTGYQFLRLFCRLSFILWQVFILNCCCCSCVVTYERKFSCFLLYNTGKHVHLMPG